MPGTVTIQRDPVLLVADLPDDDLKTGGPQRWRYTSPAVSDALHEQFKQMFAKHQNLPLGKK